jgi:hypothetical protein
MADVLSTPAGRRPESGTPSSTRQFGETLIVPFVRAVTTVLQANWTGRRDDRNPKSAAK